MELVIRQSHNSIVTLRSSNRKSNRGPSTSKKNIALLSNLLLVDDFVSQRGYLACKKNPVPGNRTGYFCSEDESFVINYVTDNQSVKIFNYTFFSPF